MLYLSFENISSRNTLFRILLKQGGKVIDRFIANSQMPDSKVGEVVRFWRREYDFSADEAVLMIQKIKEHRDNLRRQNEGV